MSNFNESIAESLVQKETAEILRDAIDLGIASLADGTIIENIPFLGTIHKVYKLGLSISDKRFYNKVSHFLYELHRISAAGKTEMIARLHTDNERARETGEVLIEILDKCDDNRKASIIAKLFSDYILGCISFDDFNRFSRIVIQAYLFDLSSLREYIDNPARIGTDVSLLTLGIIGIKTEMARERQPVSMMSRFTKNQIEYYVNETGQRLFELIKSYI